MKKFLLLSVAMLLCVVSAEAQDVLTKHNGEDLQVIVKEVDGKNVRYVLFSEPNGVIYTIPKSDILIIRYASGRNEIFNSRRTPYNHNVKSHRNMDYEIYEGMSYKELKYIYDYRYYRLSQSSEFYSPAWCGVASGFIPGLGQMMCGEIGRGFAFLGGVVGGLAISLITPIGLVVVPAVQIWGIVDATRVAKVMNMYNSELQSQYSSISIDLHPSLTPTFSQSGIGVASGFTLSLTF